MKMFAEIGDEKHEIEVVREGESVIARVGDRRYELEISEPEAGAFLIKNSGKITEVSVRSAGLEAPFTARVGGTSYEIRLIDPKRLRGSGAGDDSSQGFAEIRTVMPGKVVRILKERGSSVERGDGVMIIEAMKMQNEIKAPKAGVVKEVRIGEGGTVAAGDVLAVIE